jgi:hypothetical protein
MPGAVELYDQVLARKIIIFKGNRASRPLLDPTAADHLLLAAACTGSSGNEEQRDNLTEIQLSNDLKPQHDC